MGRTPGGEAAPEVPHVKSGGDPKDSYRPIIETLNSALRAEEDMSDPILAPYRGVLRALTPGSERPGPEGHKLLMLEGVGRLLASIGRRDVALIGAHSNLQVQRDGAPLHAVALRRHR